MLTLVHVVEWRAAVPPHEVAVSDDRGASLSYAELLAGMEPVAELPRNATGKLLRAALREPFWAGRDRRVS